ncbi:MAG: AtaL-like protein [Gammaproteobacteria bacterium]
MLEFEHIVQINDPDDAKIRPITRAQLWEGLVLRARDPGKFNAALTCRVADEIPAGFTRYIQAGDTEFRDQVTLTHLEKIETVIVGADQSLHAESLTAIEEPASGCLFVRFRYRRDMDDSSEGAMIGEHLKSAYFHTDIEAIALIRMLIEGELLGQKPN